MRERYQIGQERAVQQFCRMAQQKNPALQMVLPMTEVVGLLQEGVGNLLREAGLALMKLVMEEEVRQLAGERHQQHEGRQAYRWGTEAGYCVVDGQKVRLRRTRLRNPDNCEQPLGSYQMLRRRGPMTDAVWNKMMRGLSTRNYGAVVKGLPPSLWGGEVGGERQLHRCQPRQTERADGASAGRVGAVRGAHRRHAVPGPADAGGSGHQ